MISTKTPQIRFPDFDTEWSIKTIRTYSSKVGSGSTPSGGSKVYQKQGIPFIRSQNVADNRLDLTDTTFISSEIHDKMKGSKVKPFDILLNITGGSIGRSCVVPSDFKEGNVNQHVCIVRFQDNILPEFAQAYLSSFNGQKNIMRNQAGGGREGLNFEAVKDIKLPYTNKEEQQKIADFLSSIDKKITLLKEKHDLLTQYKKGVMQKLFSQEIRFNDEAGNDFPDWSNTKFGKVFERVTQKNKEDNQNVLTISAQRGLINQQKYFNKSVSAKDVTGYYLLNNGDFAYNKSYSKGYPMGAIKRLNNYDKGVVSTLYICFKSHGNQHDAFWEQYFEAGLLNREISKIAQEGARNHGLLNVSVTEFFKDISVLEPSEKEQIRISEFLGALDKKLNLVSEQIDHTQTFKNGLLQQMFV
ncbi:restriction endonuclease subunit S [Aliivibrio fischeri]|uniref:restriction endonuclease subunit S n=1 Tax=Aliivibrio fischeri TaxID=668 RepID=UPI0012DAE4D7|nr:restriction endonuclease subunit S [Aliivibrio fischeri]MUJ28545.1 restriction endonuclease subunit S [Aliivibrio fischeri]